MFAPEDLVDALGESFTRTTARILFSSYRTYGEVTAGLNFGEQATAGLGPLSNPIASVESEVSAADILAARAYLCAHEAL